MALYNRDPLDWVDDIPVFTPASDYLDTYEEIASYHLRHLAAHGRSPFMTDNQIEESNNATADLVRRYVPLGSKILDAGVGTGNQWKEFLDYDIHGVDISIEYLKIAKDNSVKVSKAQIADLPYADNNFDAVTVCDVLEHLIDLDASVQELSRVLKPNGYFIVRVPNNEDLSSYMGEQKFKYAHVRNFSASSLRLYMEKCFGYTFVEESYYAKGFYTSSQLINPAVSRGSQLHEILSRIRQTLAQDQLRQSLYNRQSLQQLTDAYEMLSRCLIPSLEEQVDALITIRDLKDSCFDELADVMLHPAELLGVFQKQY